MAEVKSQKTEKMKKPRENPRNDVVTMNADVMAVGVVVEDVVISIRNVLKKCALDGKMPPQKNGRR